MVKLFAFLAAPAGNSQELTLRATIAKSGSVSIKAAAVPVTIDFLGERLHGMYDFI